jgi:hypothetical protein
VCCQIWAQKQLEVREAPNDMGRFGDGAMSDLDDWEFAGDDEAKMTIRAAVRYLLRGTTDGVRGDIVQEIITIVRQAASGLPPEG